MISSYIEELIIQNYLLGHSRDEIAEETGVAPGSVSNKVNDWKKRIVAPDIEELRRFAVNLRNSGVKQCAKGLRFLQLLKGLKIIIENDDIDSDLEVMRFGLEELKQLWLTVTEIASSRNESREDAVSFFIKDVEENYYDKLRFEDKVKEKRNELAMLNTQLNTRTKSVHAAIHRTFTSFSLPERYY